MIAADKNRKILLLIVLVLGALATAAFVFDGPGTDPVSWVFSCLTFCVGIWGALVADRQQVTGTGAGRFAVIAAAPTAVVAAQTVHAAAPTITAGLLGFLFAYAARLLAKEAPSRRQ